MDTTSIKCKAWLIRSVFHTNLIFVVYIFLSWRRRYYSICKNKELWFKIRKNRPQELCFFNSLRLSMTVKLYMHMYVKKGCFRKKASISIKFAINMRILMLAWANMNTPRPIKSLGWLRAVLDDAPLYRPELIPGRTG